ncbi:winged helix-turn-helix domain-containing protein [Brevibacillus sp. BC25]|uniref:ArsR/SmtB family transcription factor n=1 Tax=Brevibacillus sp. BC25 TaxID=1144308 RepID=UPI000270DDBF|nr:winged helix-turn-helix domain-containing protein [Brevibacillus sp. BC25]EJL28154.1 putative transcriptional regulator [Brevibacillus sp. BC25]
MEQKSIFIIENYDQLKVISDPLRTKMLMHLVEKPHTGQQLSQLFGLSRAKILYHLRELEKHGIIQLVKKEEKGGNILKYYQAVARGFIPADHLLTYTESKEATRQSYVEVLQRAKTRALSAPEEAFALTSSEVENWPRISLQSEVRVSEQAFVSFLQKYRNLLHELQQSSLDDPSSKQDYYLMITGFQIDEPLFKKDGQE